MALKRLTSAAAALAIGAMAATAQAQSESPTLAAVKERGKLICIGNSGYPGFGFLAEDGSFSGFDVDWCRAWAAATLGDADKFEIRPASGAQRFTLLVSNEGDVGARSTTWTFSRDTTQGVHFLSPYYYDGQGFLVRKADGINRVEDLDGATICVYTGSTSELNVADAMTSRGLTYKLTAFDDDRPLFSAYESGQCDTTSTDRSFLASYSQTVLQNPDDHKVLDEIISKEPLAPYVRADDWQWAKIINWVVKAAITAEEFGITSENVDDVLASSKDPAVRRFLGAEDELGSNLGLPQDWAYQVIKQVGNYGEIYERNLGSGSAFKLPRGKNVLHTDGGLIYSPPIR